MEDLSTSVKAHKLTMVNRKSCSLNGVKDVLSFDIHEVLLETEQGMLMVKGADLHDSLTYSDAGGLSHKSESLLTRLFR